VVVTGGHADFALGTDVYVDAETTNVLEPESPATNLDVHGTGCVFSAVIAARLALNESPLEAVTKSKSFVSEAIRSAVKVGSGFVLGTFTPG
jgi:hydroxymethylpyrimidine/phosphomethylpyrimidine kinase